MRFDFHAQNRANPRRCQATTVWGLTIVSVSARRDQTRESTTQKARSIGATCGRFVFRRRTASCCRSARFSATRLALGRKAERSAPIIATSSSITPEPPLGPVGMSAANPPHSCSRVAPEPRAYTRGFPTGQLFTTTGDKTVARVRTIGTHKGAFMEMPATGKSIAMKLIDITRFNDDGHARKHWGVADMLTMMQQLGAIPACPPA